MRASAELLAQLLDIDRRIEPCRLDRHAHLCTKSELRLRELGIDSYLREIRDLTRAAGRWSQIRPLDLRTGCSALEYVPVAGQLPLLHPADASVALNSHAAVITALPDGQIGFGAWAQSLRLRAFQAPAADVDHEILRSWMHEFFEASHALAVALDLERRHADRALGYH